LAEFVTSIPIEQRFPDFKLKGLLKETMSDILPPEILHHRKQGFNVPVTAWFRGDLSSYSRDILLSSKARTCGFWNPGEVENLLDRHAKGHENFGAILWSLVIFELWRQQWHA
jgi:asparagine synthase (glutamine-hydrolysing)